jgi:hypothetical protein
MASGFHRKKGNSLSSRHTCGDERGAPGGTRRAGRRGDPVVFFVARRLFIQLERIELPVHEFDACSHADPHPTMTSVTGS